MCLRYFGLKHNTQNAGMEVSMKYDIAIIGGSLGGVQAAISAAKQNKKVYLCEETDWIGGQLTSQAVPPDEHPWIEEFGATKRYLDFRKSVRDYYRSIPEFKDEVRQKECFCPGNSWVSRVAHEPKVAFQLFEDEIAEYLQDGRLTLEYFTVAVDSVVENDTIKSVTVKNLQTKEEKSIEAEYFLDATDCGDLLPIVGAEYRTGAESKELTGELHAPEVGDPYDMQPITWVAALELNPDGDYKLEKPEKYDYFASLGVPYDNNLLFSWWMADAHTQKKTFLPMFDGEYEGKPLGLWSYRRVIDTANYTDGRKEVTLLNWPQNDFALGNVFEDKDAKENLELSRQQTLCSIYWLQNEAPRVDGGKGYAVKLRPDIMGTEDGLAKAAYIRESRRIVAKKTICEQDVSKRNNDLPPKLVDSVGVGHYAIDIHMTTKSHSFLYDATYPFEIPLSSMIPVRMKNLLPACKNIGSTHLTSGCYRLHPVEWNVGEVAGYAAAYCIDHKVTFEELLTSELKTFQDELEREGVQLHWDFSKMSV